MKRILITCLFLAACGSPSEPVVVTKIVKEAVPTSCKPTLPPRPSLKTKDEIKAALTAAATLDDKVKIVSEQLLLYIGWTPVVEAALTGCGGSPDVGNH